MELNDDELTALHGMLEEWVQSSEAWTDEDRDHKASMFGKVRYEARRREFGWAR